MSVSTEEPSAEQAEAKRRGAFSSRTVFILAAIGSAVGLGNIWRFPYVAYENGGGSFVVPYLVALLVAGIPFLFLDYAIGHRFRGSPPLAYARLRKWTEGIGWWVTLVCAIIAIYYAAIIGWAASYTGFSVTKSWGDDPNAFLFEQFLKVPDPTVGLSFNAAVLIPLTIVWVVLLAVLLLGVQKGVGISAAIFIPLLVVIFLILVIQAIQLPGATEGLNALFTPNWAALLSPQVWVAAFGQIFFSLSVGFGIMITYASYLGRKEDLTGAGLVVGFSNSSFELLAGIGVFSAVGFMAQASGVAIDEVVTDGVGLAFVAFPAIINQAPGGSLLGVLFFASLVLAGFTSMVSIVEVVVAAVRDKFELTRTKAVLIVVLPLAVISIVLLGTTTGLYVLDIMDHFVNSYGILLSSIVAMLLITWGLRKLPMLRTHVNQTSSIKLGSWWTVLLGIVAPVVLAVNLVLALVGDITEPYGGYPQWMLVVFGWVMAVLLIIIGFVLPKLAWRDPDALHDPLLPEPGPSDAAEEVTK